MSDEARLGLDMGWIDVDVVDRMCFERSRAYIGMPGGRKVLVTHQRRQESVVELLPFE